MAFWSQAKIEPKRNFRWMAEVTGVRDLKLALKKFKKPSFEIKATEHMYLNHKFNYPGRLNWKESEMVIVNAANQANDGFAFDTAKTFMDIIINAGYQDPSKAANNPSQKTLSKNLMVEGIGSIIKVRQLGPDGNSQDTSAQEVWEIHKPIITGISFSELDYSNEEINDLTVTFVYDYAILKGTSGNQ